MEAHLKSTFLPRRRANDWSSNHSLNLAVTCHWVSNGEPQITAVLPHPKWNDGRSERAQGDKPTLSSPGEAITPTKPTVPLSPSTRLISHHSITQRVSVRNHPTRPAFYSGFLPDYNEQCVCVFRRVRPHLFVCECVASGRDADVHVFPASKKDFCVYFIFLVLISFKLETVSRADR